jgi:hypothetical protein
VKNPRGEPPWNLGGEPRWERLWRTSVKNLRGEP